MFLPRLKNILIELVYWFFHNPNTLEFVMPRYSQKKFRYLNIRVFHIEKFSKK